MKKYYAEPGGDIKKELQKRCDSLQLMWLLDYELVCQEAKKIETTDGGPYQLAKEGSPLLRREPQLRVVARLRNLWCSEAQGLEFKAWEPVKI